MYFSAIVKVILSIALVIGASAATALSARAADAYCPSRSHQRPQKVPENLVGRVAQALQIDAAFARDTTFVRCAGPALMACTVGANLVCGKADARRKNPGAAAWCRDNPASTIVPMAATGHATIYEWTCVGSRAVAGKAVVSVDRQGYIVENWKTVP